MYRIGVSLCAVLLVGCTSREQAAQMPEPETSVFAAYVGEWNLQAFSRDGGDPLVELGLMAGESAEEWSMIFDHLDAPVSAVSLTSSGDSVTVEFAPYRSALREGVMVTTTTVLHAHGDELSGRFSAVYASGEPKVLRGRLAGTRFN